MTQDQALLSTAQRLCHLQGHCFLSGLRGSSSCPFSQAVGAEKERGWIVEGLECRAKEDSISVMSAQRCRAGEEPMLSGVPPALHGGQDGPCLPWTLLLCVSLLQIHFSSTAQRFSEHQGLRAPLARTHVASLLPQHWLYLAQHLRPLLREASRSTPLFLTLPFLGPPRPLDYNHSFLCKHLP